MEHHPLVGTWKLLSATLEDTDGSVRYPFGKDPIGCLTYTADGYVHWAVMQANRIPFASGDILHATDAEKVAAAESYIAYCGRYTLEAGKVIHHIEISSIPNQVGGAHERFFEVTEGRLHIATPPILAGGSTRTGHLLLERASKP